MSPHRVDRPQMSRGSRAAGMLFEYPDRATFAREEQRRFEVLTAHWDVPLNRLDLHARKPTR